MAKRRNVLRQKLNGAIPATKITKITNLIESQTLQQTLISIKHISAMFRLLIVLKLQAADMAKILWDFYD